LERPLLDLLPDAGQISPRKDLPGGEVRHRLATVLRFQINLELFLGAQITAASFSGVLFGASDELLLLMFFPVLSRQGRHGSGRPAGSLHHARPSAL